MKQIRRGVFETNSSSMHSLTVMKRNDKYTPEEILDGIWLYDICEYYGGNIADNNNWVDKINWETPLYWKLLKEPNEN